MCLAGTSVVGKKSSLLKLSLLSFCWCFHLFLPRNRCNSQATEASLSCPFGVITPRYPKHKLVFLLEISLREATITVELRDSSFFQYCPGSCYIWSENPGRMLRKSTARPLWCFISYCMSAWILPHSTLRYIAESFARSRGNGSLWMQSCLCS